MKRWAAMLVLILATTALVACDPSPPPERNCPTVPDSISSEILFDVNADRAAAGLPGLWWHDTLACNARDWATHMAQTGDFSHQDLAGFWNDPLYGNFTYLGENILRGPAFLNGHDIHGYFMRSPGHRENVLGPFDTIGIAVVRNGDMIFVAEEFANH